MQFADGASKYSPVGSYTLGNDNLVAWIPWTFSQNDENLDVWIHGSRVIPFTTGKKPPAVGV